MSTSFILVVAVLLVIQQHTSALTCYQCTAGTDGCGGSTFNSKGGGVTTVTSTTTGVSCAKATYSSNSNSATRSGPGSCTATSVAATSSSDGYTISCCSTDYCNGSSMTSASVLLAMATAALCIFYKK